MIVYKVVQRTYPDKLISVIMTGKASIQYYPNIVCTAPKWLADKGYHLMAFKRFKDARYFAVGNQQIWRAEVTETTSNLPERLFISVLHKGKVIPSGGKTDGKTWPRGTVMCKTIKLIKKVN